jgi:hypothetical protein
VCTFIPTHHAEDDNYCANRHALRRRKKYRALPGTPRSPLQRPKAVIKLHPSRRRCVLPSPPLHSPHCFRTNWIAPQRPDRDNETPNWHFHSPFLECVRLTLFVPFTHSPHLDACALRHTGLPSLPCPAKIALSSVPAIHRSVLSTRFTISHRSHIKFPSGFHSISLNPSAADRFPKQQQRRDVIVYDFFIVSVCV